MITFSGCSFLNPLIWKILFKTQGLKYCCNASKCTFAPLIPLARQMFLKKLQINWLLLYSKYKWSVSNWGSTRMWGGVLALVQQRTFKQTGSRLCQVWMQHKGQHLDVRWWYRAQTAQFKVMHILSWLDWGRRSRRLENTENAN